MLWSLGKYINYKSNLQCHDPVTTMPEFVQPLCHFVFANVADCMSQRVSFGEAVFNRPSAMFANLG